MGGYVCLEIPHNSSSLLPISLRSLHRLTGSVRLQGYLSRLKNDNISRIPLPAITLPFAQLLQSWWIKMVTSSEKIWKSGCSWTAYPASTMNMVIRLSGALCDSLPAGT